MALTLPYPSLVFVPLDILTADQMNEIVANYEYIANQFPIAASNIDFTTFVYFKDFSSFTATTSETSYGTIDLPAGDYMIGVQAHVSTNGNSATNYSGEVRARLNSVSGTSVAYASYYFWQSSSNQDIAVDIFNMGKATLTETTTVHFTAKRSGNMTSFQRPAIVAIRIS